MNTETQGNARAFFMILILHSAVAGGYAQENGSISGQVVLVGSRSPVGAGSVAAVRPAIELPKGYVPGRDRPPPVAYYGAISNGTFSIKGLPAGTFRLCITGAPGLLDPCGWKREQSVSIASNGTARVTISVQPAVVVAVRLNDPQRLLEKSGLDARAITTPVWVEVATADGRASRTLLGQRLDATTYEYSGPVPAGEQLQVRARGARYAVKETLSGRVASAGAAVERVVQVPAPQASQSRTGRMARPGKPVVAVVELTGSN